MNVTYRNGCSTWIGVVYPNGYTNIWFNADELEDFEKYDENGDMYNTGDTYNTGEFKSGKTVFHHANDSERLWQKGIMRFNGEKRRTEEKRRGKSVEEKKKEERRKKREDN